MCTLQDSHFRQSPVRAAHACPLGQFLCPSQCSYLAAGASLIMLIRIVLSSYTTPCILCRLEHARNHVQGALHPAAKMRKLNTLPSCRVCKDMRMLHIRGVTRTGSHVLEVFLQNRPAGCLLAPVGHHHRGASDNLTGLALSVNLAQLHSTAVPQQLTCPAAYCICPHLCTVNFLYSAVNA